MAINRFIGVDLAWAEKPGDGTADNETGLVMIDGAGAVLAADWRRGVAATRDWIDAHADHGGTLAFVDAPLVVDNEGGQRLCEKHVGQRYGAWKVSANTTNKSSKNKAGLALLHALESRGWSYSSGLSGPPSAGLHLSECYPYTTLVGTPELFFLAPASGGRAERPKYKRKPRGMSVAVWRPLRATNCDELIAKLAALSTADPPLNLASHHTTARLVHEPSPEDDVSYKHREDLIDAAIAAWTALVWYRHGCTRCQVLGPEPSDGREPTIIAPASDIQRLLAQPHPLK